MSTIRPVDAHARDLGAFRAAGLEGQALSGSDFTDFYRENFPRIVNALMRDGSVTGLAEAQDAAQDAFVTALRSWSRISGLEYPMAYIAKTAVRLARRRSTKAAREIPAESIAGLLIASPADEPAGMAAGRDMVAKMIAQLPERQAVTFRLRMDGATPEEIGVILNVRASTARSNLRFARTTLRALIREQMHEHLGMHRDEA